jgi:hypothetical protein
MEGFIFMRPVLFYSFSDKSKGTVFMKHFKKLFGIVVLIAVIGGLVPDW